MPKLSLGMPKLCHTFFGSVIAGICSERYCSKTPSFKELQRHGGPVKLCTDSLISGLKHCKKKQNHLEVRTFEIPKVSLSTGTGSYSVVRTHVPTVTIGTPTEAEGLSTRPTWQPFPKHTHCCTGSYIALEHKHRDWELQCGHGFEPMFRVLIHVRRMQCPLFRCGSQRISLWHCKICWQSFFISWKLQC